MKKQYLIMLDTDDQKTINKFKKEFDKYMKYGGNNENNKKPYNRL